MDRKFRMRFLNSLSDNPKSKIQNLKRLALGAMLASFCRETACYHRCHEARP